MKHSISVIASADAPRRPHDRGTSPAEHGIGRILIPAILLCSLAFAAPRLMAQDAAPPAERPSYGVFGHINFNNHNADFRALPGTPSCCPQYEEGAGTGFSLGGLYAYPIGSGVQLALRASYVVRDAALETTEPTLVSGAEGPISGSILHTIDASVSSLGLEPMLGYSFFRDLSIWAGFHAGYVTTRSFDQREELVEPVTMGTFENGLRTRNAQSGDIPDARSASLSFLAGLSYSLPLNDRGSLFLVPEIFYSYGLLGIVDNLSWSANALRAGISLRYSPLPVVPPESAIEAPTPTPPPPVAPALAAWVDALGLTGTGVEVEAANVTIEELSESKQRPLLNYLFFAENSAQLDAKYEQLTPDGTDAFNINGLHYDKTLEMYYHILDIVGQRMRNLPTATLDLVGCNGDIGAEKGNTELSAARADAVKRYLVSVWGIAPERISITTRNLPAAASNNSDPDGMAENRRVELSSDTWQILEPVTTRDILRIATPPGIRFYMKGEAERGMKNWQLRIRQGDREIATISDEGAPPSRVDWQIAENQKLVPREPFPLTFTLHVEDLQNRQAVSRTGSLPVEIVTIQKKRAQRVVRDMEISQYSLILFDFDQSAINERNQKIVDNIRRQIRDEAKVTITGYTDRMGETDHNDRLSRERAHAAARALSVRDANISGLGESVALHDNSLPEGRFYSRTVDITVETPIQE